MMLGLLACVAVLGAPMSRAEFVAALNKVEEGWTKEQVEAVLGRPDDVWPANDSEAFVTAGYEVWCYGSREHHSFPTLGCVRFRNDKAVSRTGHLGAPPSPEVIDERTLVEALRVIHPRLGKYGSPRVGAEHMIRVSNLLISLGQEKSLAALSEYTRLTQESSRNDDWLHCVVHFAYTTRAEGGIFLAPVGSINPLPPGDRSLWPTYPVIEVQGVPFCLIGLTAGGGNSTPFHEWLSWHAKELVIKTKPFVPPDDPFVLVKDVIETREWKSMFYESKGPEKKDETPVVRIRLTQRPFSESELRGLILELVSGAFKTELSGAPGADSFKKAHREFLKLKCRWDPKTQRYVRGDGTVLPDGFVVYPQHEHVFDDDPRLRLEVTISRYAERGISFSTLMDEHGTTQVPPAVLVFEEAGTKKVIAWRKVNGDDMLHGESSAGLEKALAGPPHPPSSAGGGGGFDWPYGEMVRIVLLMDGKRYEGPVLKV